MHHLCDNMINYKIAEEIIAEAIKNPTLSVTQVNKTYIESNILRYSSSILLFPLLNSSLKRIT